MARRSGVFTVNVSVDDEAVLAGLRNQRKAINQDVKRTTLAAATQTVLPSARALAAPRRYAGTIAVKSTTSGAYLTTTARGTPRAIIGLLNFGGTSRPSIYPKKAQALYFGNGQFAAAVRTPRHYRGKHFLEKSIEANLGRFTDHVERELTDIMRKRILYASTFG